jgi:hypothetical protein
MTSVLGVSLPKVGSSNQDLASPKNVALGGIAATSVIGGGVIGALKGSPLKGLAIGGAVAAVALGAALVGNASSSQRDGYCDYYGDPDCDYPGVGYDPYYPRHDYPRYDNPYYDGGYRDHDGDGAREDYPDTGYYPGGGTSRGDDW